jgi:hypothetical protein
MKKRKEIDIYFDSIRDRLKAFLRFYETALKESDEAGKVVMRDSIIALFNEVEHEFVNAMLHKEDQKSPIVTSVDNESDTFELKPRDREVILGLIDTPNEVVSFDGFKDDTQFKNTLHKLRTLFKLGAALRKSGEYSALLSRV